MLAVAKAVSQGVVLPVPFMSCATLLPTGAQFCSFCLQYTPNAPSPTVRGISLAVCMASLLFCHLDMGRKARNGRYTNNSYLSCV